MKEEKQKLVLNKRTIAHLNNLEMRHVRGGDGEEGDISRGVCPGVDVMDTYSKIKEIAKSLLSMVQKIC